MKPVLKMILKDLIAVIFTGAGVCTAVWWIREYLNPDA